MLILDVRGLSEASEGRIPGSILIPLDELTDRIAGLDRSRRTVVYCRTGGRGARAVRILRGAGFHDARNLRGGIDAWRTLDDRSGGSGLG